MTEHIRPPHPGCAHCKNLTSVLGFNAGDLSDARKKLVRAQGREHIVNEIGQADIHVADIKRLQGYRTETIAKYHTHYAEAHPNFADSAHPFAKSPAHRLTADDITEITQLLRDGLPQNEIAEAFDVSQSTVQYHATRAGLTSKDTTAPAAEVDAEPFVTDDQPWAVEALCAQTDPESFFPEKGGSNKEAKRVCANCTVAAECLDYALVNQERFGIWGGLSERERRKLLRDMNPKEEPTQPSTEGTAA